MTDRPDSVPLSPKSSGPTAVRQVPWSITDDRGRCVDLGTVAAESDQDALRAVLARPRKDLRARGWYRVKAGGVVASAEGDEFTTVGSATGRSIDAAAEAARTEARKTLVGAKFRDLLVHTVRAREEILAAPQTARGRCVLAVDTVRIESAGVYRGRATSREASGNCANCGRRAVTVYATSLYDWDAPIADCVRRAVVDDLRRFFDASPCSALTP